ncbi:unnamed protein product [Cladocopium goreaui]|uniref:Ubiquitin-like domain-containing protein n=1 Tax=Cladocopium goreaui TaxID=2562237 RepID=A0A9P1GP02_9DINO|nr:unnamed protein product [Cladocopium goreaui]
MESGIIRVAVKKMSGELLELEMKPDDLVSTLQREIATQVGVQVAHQRLWLNHASPSVLTRQGCVLAEELHRSVEMLDRNMISQMKTLAKPPQVVVTVFNMVHALLNPTMPFDPEAVDGDDGASWTQCQKMLNPHVFLKSLARFLDEVDNLPKERVESVQKCIDLLGDAFSRDHLERFSFVLSMMYDWLVVALKVGNFKHASESSALQLEATQPVCIHVDEEAPREGADLSIDLIVASGSPR